MNLTTRFTITLVAAAVVAQLAGIYSGWLLWPQGTLAINLALLVLTFAVFRIVVRSPNQERFVQIYLASIVLKILAACVLALVILWLDPSHGRPNVLFLLILYIVYTVIEVGFLLSSRRL
jgi:hypothetical protein